MNLRTLKKRSKQAVPFLIAHFGRKRADFFPAVRGDNYHGLIIRCPHKPGRFRCDCQCHPLPGTPMTGEMSGGEEPEWAERTALEELQQAVIWSRRPAAASDVDWQRILAITRCKPFDDTDFRRWALQDQEDDLNEFGDG